MRLHAFNVKFNRWLEHGPNGVVFVLCVTLITSLGVSLADSFGPAPGIIGMFFLLSLTASRLYYLVRVSCK